MRTAALAIDDQDDDGEGLLLRPAAADYLSRKLGRPITVGLLKWLAYTGRGPAFEVVLNKATYRKDALDAWCKSPDARREPRRRT
jgi:hypothetical protein